MSMTVMCMLNPIITNKEKRWFFYHLFFIDEIIFIHNNKKQIKLIKIDEML